MKAIASIYTLLLLVVVQENLLAQQNDRHVNSWLEVSAGTGSFQDADAPLAGLLGMSIQFNQNLFTLRSVVVSEVLSTSYTDVGLLYGRVLTPSSSKLFFSSMSAGIAYTSNSHTNFGLFGGNSGLSSSFSGFGIPLQANFQYRPFKIVGVGINGFGNINKNSDFYGITFSIIVGRFE